MLHQLEHPFFFGNNFTFDLSIMENHNESMGTSLIGIIAIICAIYVIYDVWSNQKSMSDGNKLLWTVLALFFSIITAILYLLMVKRK